MSQALDNLMKGLERPTNRVTFHNPNNDRFYVLTAALNKAPEGVKNEQQLYNKIEATEQYLLSFMTNLEIDPHELEKHVQFMYQLKKCIGAIASSSYAIGFRKVRA